MKIKDCSQDALSGSICAFHDVSHVIGDERRAIKFQFQFAALFKADTVGCQNGCHVCGRVTAHHSLPVIFAVQVRLIDLATDGSRVQEHVRSFEDHRAGSFRKPLVPADADTNATVPGFYRFKPGVAGAEIVFFLIDRKVRDMALPVMAGDAAISV